MGLKKSKDIMINNYFKGIYMQIKFGIIAILLAMLFCTGTYAKDIKEIKIKTSAQCGTCKEAIEKAVNKLDGIEKVNLNVETKNAEVKYDAEKTNSDKIKKAINLAGYDADETLADPKAYRKLPKCCKKGGHK
jgi:periplasmic mercuric ion binding protein